MPDFHTILELILDFFRFYFLDFVEEFFTAVAKFLILLASTLFFLFWLCLVIFAILNTLTEVAHQANYRNGNITIEEYCQRYKTSPVNVIPANCIKILSQ